MGVFGQEKKEVRKWWDTAIVSPSSSKFNPLKIERKWGEEAKGPMELPIYP